MNQRFVIQGGVPLSGEIEVHGAKNAATKLMVASLLTKEACVIENVPRISDIELTRELCERIGSVVTFEGDHALRMETPEIKQSAVPELSRRNRIPILAIAPVLHRRGAVEVPVPGGCPIGHRPINLHIEALRLMGAKVLRREYSYYAESPNGLTGADMTFEFPSVGATETVLFAGVLARGRTVLRNAAIEPEILNLVGMLRDMGANIVCDEPGRVMTIEGVRELGGVSAVVIPDRNEIVSFATAALVTDGNVLVRGADPLHIGAFLQSVRAAGGIAEVLSEGIRFSGVRPYQALNVQTAPHPGFMTDWQQPFAVLLTQAKGQSSIHETIYEERLGYLRDLARMGASVETDVACVGDPCRFSGLGYVHACRVSGPTRLRGAAIAMSDLRAGMAHVIAALAADGESVVTGIEHVERGYEKIDERLRGLGADIQRVGA